METPRHLVAQRLWQDLVLACERAGQDGYTTDDVGYIVHEFALGLFAIAFSKEELMTHLAMKLKEIGLDRLAAVNVGLDRSNPEAWSDIGQMGFRRADPKFAKAPLDDLRRLRRYRDQL